MLILGQNDIFCGIHVVNFSVWFLQLTVLKYLVASHVTEPGSLLTEPGAVIKFMSFLQSPRYMYAINLCKCIFSVGWVKETKLHCSCIGIHEQCSFVCCSNVTSLLHSHKPELTRTALTWGQRWLTHVQDSGWVVRILCCLSVDVFSRATSAYHWDTTGHPHCLLTNLAGKEEMLSESMLDVVTTHWTSNVHLQVKSS